MTFRDEYRELKEQSGLTWDEFVSQEMHHTSELSGLTEQLTEIERLSQQVETLSEHVEANKNTYQKMQRELHELRVLVNHEGGWE